MPTSLQNIAIATGGVAQDLLPARLGRGAVIISPISEDCWVNFGVTAAVNVGERIVNGASARFSVEHYPEVGARVSVFSATTSSQIMVRET